MTPPSDIPSDGQPVSPVRQCFLQRLAALNVKPTTHAHYVRWAENWIKARGNRSADSTTAFLDALGRSSHLADWQYRQAVDAVYILAHDILALPWAAAYHWQGLSDQAYALEPDHRTHGREAIPVRAVLPPPPDPSVPLPDTDAEIARSTTVLRRAIRLAGLAYATEQTYVYWNTRFTRFCLECLKQTPQDAGPAAITAYLDYLALERHVSDSTQNQALNAMVFLLCRALYNKDKCRARLNKTVLHKMRFIAIMASGALLLCVLGYAGYALFVSIRQDAVGPSYGYILDDWPDGDHSDKDHWRGGVFFGIKADKIRLLAKPKGEGVDAHSKKFFVRLPMSDQAFDDLILRLQSSDDFAYRALDTFDGSSLFFIPDWFPRPEEAVFVCRARDESSWPVLVVRGRDGFTYLHLN